MKRGIRPCSSRARGTGRTAPRHRPRVAAAMQRTRELEVVSRGAKLRFAVCALDLRWRVLRQRARQPLHRGSASRAAVAAGCAGRPRPCSGGFASAQLPRASPENRGRDAQHHATRLSHPARFTTTSPRQQHRLGMFQRLGRAVDDHDVAVLEFSFAGGLAAEDALAPNAGERHRRRPRAALRPRTCRCTRIRAAAPPSAPASANSASFAESSPRAITLRNIS